MDHQNDTLNEAERKQIEEFVINNAAGRAKDQRVTADLHRLKLQSGRECYLKIFKTDFLHLYLIENHALRSLSWTGRVCPVLYSSPNLDGPVRPELSDRHFLVKPLFKKSLHRGAKSTTLLDNAAQLVALADMLHREGWYDFDENWENEGINDEGRLIRFDMDAAFPCYLLSPKFNAAFHSPSTAELKSRLNEICRILNQEELVLVSVAVKICRFLLDQAGDFSELTQQLSTPRSAAAVRRGNGLSRARTVNWLQKSMTTASNFLRELSGTPSSQTASNEQTNGSRKQEIRSETKWLNLWTQRLGANRDAHMLPLTITEASLLGLLFSELLQNKAIGWKLKDFYYSLLLLLAAKLQKMSTVYSDKNQQIFSAFVEELYEFKHLAPPPVQQIEPVKEEDPTPQVTVLRIPMEKIELSGSAWGATKKQGSGGCQDLVLNYKNAPFPFLVLADGVSNAKGKEAIRILEKQGNQIYKEMAQKRDLYSPKQWVAQLIQRTHVALRQAHAQTTVVVIMLCNHPKATVVLAQFGDSPWVIIKEDLEGGSPHAQKNMLVCDEKMLGTAGIGSEGSIDEGIVELPLEVGTYHIRAYSDGIPERLQSIVITPGSIIELVEEVSRWGTQYPNEVGHDDWSIAGIDFTVNEETIEPVKPAKIAAPVDPGANWVAACTNISPSLFPLSQPAREFWRRALASEHCQELAGYQVIKEAGFVMEVTEGQEKQTGPIDTAPTETPSGKKQSRHPNYALLSIIAVVFFAVGFVILYFVNDYLNHNPGGNNVNKPAAAPPPIPTPSFETSRQKEIFTILNNGDAAAFGPLAPTDEIDSPPLNEIIPALAVVLRKTTWRVSIQIHTSLNGKEADNLATAKSRGLKVLDKLKSLGISGDRIELYPKGEQTPIHPKPRDNKEAEENRRIVILRLD